MNDILPTFRPNSADYTAAAFQLAPSLIDLLLPGTGSFFGVLIGSVIPGQRVDRLARYISELSRRCRFLRDVLDAHSGRLDAIESAMDKSLTQKVTPAPVA